MTQVNLRRSVLWSAMESLVSLLSSLATVLIAAKILGPEEFGLASIAFFVGSLAELFVAVPFSEAIIRRDTISRTILDTAFTSMLILGILAFLVLALSSPIIASLYDRPELKLLIVAQATTCLFLGLRGTQEAVLAREMRFKMLSIRSVSAKLTSTAAILLLAGFGAGAWSIIIGNIVFAATSTALILSTTTGLPGLRLHRTSILDLSKFGIFSFADAIFSAGTPRLFAFLLGYFHGVAATGAVGVAFRISDTIGSLIASLTLRLALPVFSSIRSDRARFLATVVFASRLTAIISVPTFLGLAMISTDVATLMLGPEWPSANVALFVVSIFAFFNFSCVMAQPVVKAVGRPSLLLWLHVVGQLSILLGALVCFRLGLDIHLGTWIAYGIVYFITSLLIQRSASGISIEAHIRVLAPSILASGGMIALILLFQRYLPMSHPIASMIIKIAMGFCSYAIMIALLERKTISRLVSGEQRT